MIVLASTALFVCLAGVTALLIAALLWDARHAILGALEVTAIQRPRRTVEIRRRVRLAPAAASLPALPRRAAA